MNLVMIRRQRKFQFSVHFHVICLFIFIIFLFFLVFCIDNIYIKVKGKTIPVTGREFP
jgi:hypothetical protein